MEKTRTPVTVRRSTAGRRYPADPPRASVYLQGIDTEEIVSTIHGRPAPTVSATAALADRSDRRRVALRAHACSVLRLERNACSRHVSRENLCSCSDNVGDHSCDA